VNRVFPSILLYLVTVACSDTEAPSLSGRTPHLPTPTPTALGVVSGRIDFTIDSELAPEGDNGSFTMTGAINDAGELISRHVEDDDRIVIERELRGELGTIFVHMEGGARQPGEPTTLTWTITGGTRGYIGITGTGTGTDELTGPISLRGQFVGHAEK
jgi:hypothetical protein